MFRDVARIRQGTHGSFDDGLALAFALRGLHKEYEDWWDRRTDAAPLIVALKRSGAL
jgi:hypothetical protein